MILVHLFSIFGKEANEVRINLYSRYLEPFPSELLMKAVDKLILTRKFLPTVADIIEEVKSIDSIQHPVVDDWDEAWRIIDREMYRCAGTNRTPNFEGNKAIEAILPPAAFHELCMTLEKNMPTVKAQLRDMYKSAKTRLDNQRKNKAITGDVALLENKDVPRIDY